MKNFEPICFVALLLSVFIYLPFEVYGEDYQALSTGDGVRLLSSPHFELHSFRLAFIVDREVNLIQMDFSPYSFNVTKSGTVALVLPYQGTIKDSTGWEVKNFEKNSVLLKKYSCSEEVPCHAFPREFVNFEVEGKLDSKIGNHHIVSFEIYNSAPPSEEYDFVLNNKEHTEQYDLGFRKLENGKAIIIVESTAFNLKENPTSKYDTFVNRGTGYENKQFVWDISEIGFVHAEYDVVEKPAIEPGLQVLESPEVKEAVGFVGTTLYTILLGAISSVVGGIFLIKYVNRKLKNDPSNRAWIVPVDITPKYVSFVDGTVVDYDKAENDIRLKKNKVTSQNRIYELEVKNVGKKPIQIHAKLNHRKTPITREELEKIAVNAEPILMPGESDFFTFEFDRKYLVDGGSYYAGIFIEYKLDKKRTSQICKIWEIKSSTRSRKVEWMNDPD